MKQIINQRGRETPGITTIWRRLVVFTVASVPRAVSLDGHNTLVRKILVRPSHR
jgi:hypothetical protein